MFKVYLQTEEKTEHVIIGLARLSHLEFLDANLHQTGSALHAIFWYLILLKISLFCVILVFPLLCSDPPSSEVKKAPTGSSDAVTSSSLSTPAYQSAWVSANPGQRTMADIVKMGRPQQQKNIALPRSSEAQESESKAPLKDEWPSIEKQDVSYPSSSVLKPTAESKMSADQFSESQHLDETKSYPIGSHPDADHNPPASVSSRNLVDDDDSRDSSVCDDENNKAERHSYEENGGEIFSVLVFL